ncbi:MAG: dihydropteroate synthase [SAR324 cluster bacterium]|nr:dihydropteroate synthase [SAR324 cluster bacterium]
MSIVLQSPTQQLRSKNRTFFLKQPLLVGIVNVTPNSFSDGGRFHSLEQVLVHVRQMIQDGADWIEIGGESTGPGSESVELEIELQRVIPVIAAIRQESDVWISVDTYKAEVAYQAIEAGADVVNDVTALRGDASMVHVLAKAQVPVIIMYAKDTDARTTTKPVHYEDVIQIIQEFFKERLAFMKAQGIALENIILDPGMGFFVSGAARYSFEIIQRLPELTQWGYPVMISTSRKSFLANVSPGKTLDVHEREIPTAVTSAIATWQGASLLRLHNVSQGRLVLDTVKELQKLS